MDDDNKKYYRFEQPLQSNITSYVLFFGSISVIIIIIIFIFLVIFSGDDSQPQLPTKSVYSNRYYNSSLDDNSMSFSSFKTIKGGVKKIKSF